MEQAGCHLAHVAPYAYTHARAHNITALHTHTHSLVCCCTCAWQEVRGLDGIKETSLVLQPGENSPFKAFDQTGAGLPLKIAVVNGLGNAKKLIGNMKAGTAK